MLYPNRLPSPHCKLGVFCQHPKPEAQVSAVPQKHELLLVRRSCVPTCRAFHVASRSAPAKTDLALSFVDGETFPHPAQEIAPCQELPITSLGKAFCSTNALRFEAATSSSPCFTPPLHCNTRLHQLIVRAAPPFGAFVGWKLMRLRLNASLCVSTVVHGFLAVGDALLVLFLFTCVANACHQHPPLGHKVFLGTCGRLLSQTLQLDSCREGWDCNHNTAANGTTTAIADLCTSTEICSAELL